MKILNSVMLLRNGDEWGYATVDLMCIDLFTGQTGFYKYGAAPSFIRTGKSVRRVKGISMAAGILAGEGRPRTWCACACAPAASLSSPATGW